VIEDFYFIDSLPLTIRILFSLT